jgi:hypothetical protein
MDAVKKWHFKKAAAEENYRNFPRMEELQGRTGVTEQD